jgi:hypothetical protein
MTGEQEDDDGVFKEWFDKPTLREMLHYTGLDEQTSLRHADLDKLLETSPVTASYRDARESAGEQTRYRDDVTDTIDMRKRYATEASVSEEDEAPRRRPRRKGSVAR